MPDAPPFEIFYASQAQDDIAYWRRTDKQVSCRVERLLADMILHPFTGIGKPEPLRHQLAGYWSRRITGVRCAALDVRAGAPYTGGMIEHVRSFAVKGLTLCL